MYTELEGVYYKILISCRYLHQTSQPLKRSIVIVLQINLNVGANEVSITQQKANLQLSCITK